MLVSLRGQALGRTTQMIASDLRSGVEQLGDMIAAASTIVPFTGAGISTECGIPDFRSPGGLWTRNRPVRGEPVKTATVSFGQAMPEHAMRRATELAQHCDLFLAIGSSLVVWPAAGFPMLAKNCGARLVIINNEPTEQDDIADLVIRHDIGETLGPFVGN